MDMQKPFKLIAVGLICLGGAIQASAASRATTTTLVLSPNDAVSPGTKVTLTASVSNGSAVTRGTVNFCNQSMSVCIPGDGLYATAQLTSAGTATTHLRFAVGTHNIKAVFVGTTSNRSSTSSTQALVVASASQ